MGVVGCRARSQRACKGLGAAAFSRALGVRSMGGC